MEDALFWLRWGNQVAGRRGRWMTVAIWIVAVAVLSAVFPGVSQFENNNANNFPATAWSNQATQVIQQQFPNNKGIPALVVFYRKGGLTTSDYASIQSVSKTLSSHPLPDQQAIVRYDKLPEQALTQMASKDETSFVMPVILKQNTDQTKLPKDLTQLETVVTQSVGHNPFTEKSLGAAGLHARVTGPAGIAVDTLNLFQGADIALLIATVFLVLALLFVLYRSPILAIIPLVGVGLAYGAINPILGILAKHGLITVDGQTVSIMTVLLFGAGTDYCLFLINRYREELLSERNAREAMKRAVQGASGAIAMSGITVVIALLTLLFSQYGSEHRFAIPFSLAILVMFINAITFVPALLAILRRASFVPFIPRTEAMERERAEKRGKPLPKRVRHRSRFGIRLGTSITKRDRDDLLDWDCIALLFRCVGTGLDCPAQLHGHDRH